jgi:hypothetical protein
MTEWAFLLTPLLVLPIVVLFRFIGCGFTGVGTGDFPEIPLPERKEPEFEGDPAKSPGLDTTPPNYRKYILGESGNPGLVKNSSVMPDPMAVIAYWRLVDNEIDINTGLPTPTARDEKNLHSGVYVTGHVLSAIAPTPTATPPVSGSEGRANADINRGQNSLIKSDPAARGRYFDGGYVSVPPLAGLYTPQFTIEAWVFVANNTLLQNFEYTLFDALGKYALPGSPVSDRGFRIFVRGLAQGKGYWGVKLVGGPGAPDLFPHQPHVTTGTPTHIALTVDGPLGGPKVIKLYVGGKLVSPPGPVTVPAYNIPENTPLLVGVENRGLTPTAAKDLRYPMLCGIQEVVLHRKALSVEEIENHIDINR